MCGLVGIAGDLRFQDEFTMKRLLLADYFRGPDSTGFAAIRSNYEAVIAKLASNPIDLFGMEKFKTALNGNASRVFLGHNRLKTRGTISTVNAHPFHFDHIVGAHNGTLEHSSVKALEKELGEEYAVDSMTLLAAIAKLGVKETFKLCEEGTDYSTGAWAISWVDQKEGTLNFLRNKHRSLHYAYEAPKEKKEPGYRRMFWASEWWMIREAVQSSAMGYHIHLDKQGVGFFSFAPDTLYKYDIEELCAEKKKPVKPKISTVKGAEKKTYSANRSQSADPFGRDIPESRPSLQLQRDREIRGTHITTVGTPISRQKTDSQQPTATTSTTTYRGKDKKKVVLQLVGEPEHPYAGIISEEEFTPMATNGCFFCGADVKFGDPGVTIFERDKNVLCRHCSDYPESLENPPVRVYVRASAFDAIAN